MQDSKAPIREVGKSCEAHEALPNVLIAAGRQVAVCPLEPAPPPHFASGKISGHLTYI
jgi:hypothetical protein